MKKVTLRLQVIIGGVLVVLLLILAMGAHWIAPHNPMETDITLRYQEPSTDYLLGTDAMGRCILSRLIHGSRHSLGVAFIVLMLTALISITIGMSSALVGGAWDRLFVGICDVFMAFPPLVFVIALVGAYGQKPQYLIISMVMALWVSYAKIIRSHVLVEKNKPYILSAKMAGASKFQIIFLHIWPNISPQLLILFSLGVGNVILMISGFSFLGFGMGAEAPEWGAMLSNAKKVIYTNPTLMFYPGICIFITVTAFNLFGEGLRDVLATGKGE